MISEGCEKPEDPSLVLDACHWISRATFDVIGIAGKGGRFVSGCFPLTSPTIGFDYNFNAIHDETNALFLAYKEMFEVAISQGNPWRTTLSIYAPWINKFIVRTLFS